VVRDPTPDQFRQLKRVYKAAGGDKNFVRWIGMVRKDLDQKKPRPKAPAGKRGRKRLDDYRSGMMQRALLQLILAERDGVRGNDALRQWLEPAYEKMELIEPGTYKRIGWGENVAATIHRIERKLRTEGVPKAAIYALLPLVEAMPPLKKTPKKTKIY
jgi:hypothetical protein